MQVQEAASKIPAVNPQSRRRKDGIDGLEGGLGCWAFGRSCVQVFPQHSPNFVDSQAIPRDSRCIDGTAAFPASLQKKGPLCGPFVMELAGLEPATSWVRSVSERSRPIAPVR